MPTQVAINGFGRTGRAMFRSAHEQGADLEWVGINDVMDVEMLAHLLRHDSVCSRASSPTARSRSSPPTS